MWVMREDAAALWRDGKTVSEALCDRGVSVYWYCLAAVQMQRFSVKVFTTFRSTSMSSLLKNNNPAD